MKKALTKKQLLSATIIFNADVTCRELQRIIPDGFKGSIVIYGDLISPENEAYRYFDKDYNLSMSYDTYVEDSESSHFEFSGNLFCYRAYVSSLTINGNLICRDWINADNLSVNGNLISNVVDVGKLVIKGDLIADSVEIPSDPIDYHVILGDLIISNAKNSYSNETYEFP